MSHECLGAPPRRKPRSPPSILETPEALRGDESMTGTGQPLVCRALRIGAKAVGRCERMADACGAAARYDFPLSEQKAGMQRIPPPVSAPSAHSHDCEHLWHVASALALSSNWLARELRAEEKAKHRDPRCAPLKQA